MTTTSPSSAALEPPVAVATVQAPARSPFRDLGRALVRRPAAVAALAYLLVLLFLSFAAPLVAPYDPALQDLENQFAGPSWSHLFGTDEFGRDVLSRVMYASQIALASAVIAMVVAAVLGVPLGLLAGLRRGLVDAVLGRIADAVMSLPGLVLAMAVITILGPGLVNAMFAVGIAAAPGLFRVVRGAALATAREPFMESAECIGCTTRRLVWVHLLPNVAAPLLVQVTFLMSVALLIEAGLSFIGLGVQPPVASWGSMLATAYQNQYTDPFGAVAPGVALALTVLAFNVLGDTLRDAIMTGKRS